MEIGDEQKSEEMGKSYPSADPSAGRLVKMDFRTLCLFLDGGWGRAET